MSTTRAFSYDACLTNAHRDDGSEVFGLFDDFCEDDTSDCASLDEFFAHMFEYARTQSVTLLQFTVRRGDKCPEDPLEDAVKLCTPWATLKRNDEQHVDIELSGSNVD